MKPGCRPGVEPSRESSVPRPVGILKPTAQAGGSFNVRSPSAGAVAEPRQTQGPPFKSGAASRGRVNSREPRQLDGDVSGWEVVDELVRRQDEVRNELKMDVEKKFKFVDMQMGKRSTEDEQAAEARGRQQGRQEMEDMLIRPKSKDAIMRAMEMHDEARRRSELDAEKVRALEVEVNRLRQSSAQSAAPASPGTTQEGAAPREAGGPAPAAPTAEAKANEYERGKAGPGSRSESQDENGRACAGVSPPSWTGGPHAEVPGAGRECPRCSFAVPPGMGFCSQCGSKCYIPADFMAAAAGFNAGALMATPCSAEHQEGAAIAGNPMGAGGPGFPIAPHFTASASDRRERSAEPTINKAAGRKSP